MLIIGTFEHSFELEQALAVLEHSGITRKNIMVVPMDTVPKNPNQFLSKPRDLYSNGIEVGIACATASAVLGTTLGFSYTWGPILWGLFGAFIGFSVGFGLYLYINRRIHRRHAGKLPDVSVIIQCTEGQAVLVTETMWEFGVLTVGRTLEPSKSDTSIGNN
ncbi:hypothetical protein H1S01_11260 [Heliobacterium chlorum]|uniref:Uncharacterized protein n=1 Tax=Heliobacterium chlorum TaxID=2698 RepID=A0ABR7T368_HELCL|nr:hypothetical protein [Heliobacterium chlorum]MBC9785086.1 hypothetical protein [Heliobacterium chlorum]